MACAEKSLPVYQCPWSLGLELRPTCWPCSSSAEIIRPLYQFGLISAEKTGRMYRGQIHSGFTFGTPGRYSRHVPSVAGTTAGYSRHTSGVLGTRGRFSRHVLVPVGSEAGISRRDFIQDGTPADISRHSRCSGIGRTSRGWCRLRKAAPKRSARVLHSGCTKV